MAYDYNLCLSLILTDQANTTVENTKRFAIHKAFRKGWNAW